MKTILSSRRFRGSPISIRALCQLEDRTLPFRVRDVVATDGVRHFNGKLSSGDVDSTWEMTVWQNGFWSVNGDFHDGGTLAGDFFFAEFLLGGDHSVGAKLEGSILNIIDSRHLSLSKDGSDRWIRENWPTFEGSGPSVRLHAAPAIGELVATPLVALNAVPFVVFSVGVAILVGGVVVVDLASGRKFVARSCTNQPTPPGGHRPDDPSTACVEFVPLDEGPTP